MRKFLLILTLCLISSLSIGQSTFDIIIPSDNVNVDKEQAVLNSEWVDQYRLNDVDRIIRFESGSVYSLKSRTKLGLEGAAEYYADMMEYPNFFVIKNSRMEPSLRKVVDEIIAPISLEEELKNISYRIESIEIKYAYLKSDPKENEIAEKEGWFTQMDKLLSELKTKKLTLEKELNH